MDVRGDRFWWAGCGGGGKVNESTHFTLLTVPSLLRTRIFNCHSFSHFGRCQAARLLPPPDDGGGEPG